MIVISSLYLKEYSNKYILSIGNSYYAIYLVHIPIITIINKLFSTRHPIINVFFMLFICIHIGIITHLYIENKFIYKFKNYLKNK